MRQPSIRPTTIIGSTVSRFERCSTCLIICEKMDLRTYKLTRQQLLFDLYIAYQDAARHKHKMSYVQKFNKNLKHNLEELCDDMITRKYKAQPSTCFVVKYPKKREVFAAQFRDRIVHHLYYNYTHQIFERTFIADTYSCIKGRGTHYGIARITQHIRQESQNWTKPCYAMNLDIRGYFMHINRERLLKIATDTLTNMRTHCVGFTDDVSIPSGVILTPETTWLEVRDFSFIIWLTQQIVMLNPMEDCVIIGDESEWDGVDRAKCMRYALPGVGLPIGNLTSQLFSNVYLNTFDQFIKREIKCRHYGRYVDDSVIIDSSRYWMIQQVPKIRDFLSNTLGLELHMGKLRVRTVMQGVEFLGAFIKPYRNYISNHSLHRMQSKIRINNALSVNSIISYLGAMSHYSSYNIRKSIVATITKPLTFNPELTKVNLKQHNGRNITETNKKLTI